MARRCCPSIPSTAGSARTCGRGGWPGTRSAWCPATPTPCGASRAIWIDGGKSDEWFLDIGAEAFRAALAEIGVTDIHFELFDGSHGRIDYRYTLSLAYLARRLAPS